MFPFLVALRTWCYSLHKREIQGFIHSFIQYLYSSYVPGVVPRALQTKTKCQMFIVVRTWRDEGEFQEWLPSTNMLYTLTEPGCFLPTSDRNLWANWIMLSNVYSDTVIHQSVSYSHFLSACRVKHNRLKSWNMKPSCLAFCSLFLPHHFLLFEVMLFVPLHLYMSNLTCSSQFISNVASFLICLCINPLHIAHCRDLISISWSTWIDEWVKAGVYYIRWFKEAAFSLQLHPHWYCAFKTKN